MTDPVARQNRISAGAVTFSQFEQSAGDTSAAFYKNLLEEVTDCLDEYRKMCEVLEVKCVDADGNVLAPAVSQTERLLDECRERVKFAGRHVLVDESAAAGEAGAEGSAAGSPGATGVATGTVQNREAAFRELLKIADFFGRTEPHSPVSYAIKQVVSWGNMALPELLAELIEEQSVREHLFKRTGIPPPQTGEGT